MDGIVGVTKESAEWANSTRNKNPTANLNGSNEGLARLIVILVIVDLLLAQLSPW